MVEQTTVPAKGHTKVVDQAVEATCTTTGLTEGQHCSVCNTVLVKQNVVVAKGHTSVTDKAVAATCTTTGLTEGKHCSVCNTVLVKQNTIPAKGHTSVTDEAVVATCTTTGLTEGKHCSVCNTVLVKQNVVAAKGHTSVTDKAVAATCTTTGLTEGQHCSVCNTVLVKQNVVAAKGHTSVTDKAVAATCTTTGLTEGKHCSVCNTVLVKQNVVAAKGHTSVTDNAVAATCTTTGLTEGKHCSVCNTVLVKQNTIPAKGHTSVTDEAVVATCTTTGLTEGKHCSVCNTVLVKQNVVAAKGHTSVTDKAVAATCTTTGLTEGKHCSVCNTVLVKQNVIAAKGHTSVTDRAIAATCTTAGLTEGKHCSVCNTVLVKQNTVPAKGHTVVVDEGIVATCTTIGLTEGKHCSACHTIFVAQEVVESLGHNYNGVETMPTCTKRGYTKFTCERCRDSYTSNYVDALGHTEVIDQAVSPTCTEAGLTQGKHCSICKEVLVAQEAVKAAGHSYSSEITVNPTCLSGGKRKYTCKACGDSYEQKISAVGHNYNYKINNPLTEKVFVLYACSGCGDTYNETITPTNFKLTMDNLSKVGFTGKKNEDLVIPAVFKNGTTWYRITEIQDYAFEYCSKLSSVTIPKTVTKIGGKIFYECSEYLTVKYYGTSSDWAKISKSDSWNYYEYYNSGSSSGWRRISDLIFFEELTPNYYNYKCTGENGKKQAYFYVAPECSGETIISYSIKGYEYNSDYSVSASQFEITDLTSGKRIVSLTCYPNNSDAGFVTITLEAGHEYSIELFSFGYNGSAEVIISVDYNDNYTDEFGHSHTVVTSKKVAPTCSKTGLTEGKCCSVCNKAIIPQIEIAKEPHEFEKGICIECGTSNLEFTLNTAGTEYAVSGLGNCVDTEIIIPNYFNGKPVTSISENAFSNCSELTSITMPNSITKIGSGAFSGCSGLTSITMPNSITKIGFGAFSGCSGLQEITLPFIGSEADITGRTSYYINPFGYIFGSTSYAGGTATEQTYYYVTQSGTSTSTITYSSTYYIPTSLKKVTITGKNIPSKAFYNCSGLTSVVIGNSVTTISYQAFYNCSSLTSIIFEGTSAQWSAIVKGSEWNYLTGKYTLQCTG